MNAHPIRNVSKARIRIIAAAALFCGVSVAAAAAQQAVVQGIITSADSGAPLEGVAIVLEADGRQAHAALTDRNGFYQIGGIAPGSYSLKSQMLGYQQHEQAVVLAAGQRLVASFRIAPSAVVLDRIVVTPERSAAVRDFGRQRVTAGDIRLVPTPAGSGDLATYLQTLPGVTTTGDRGGQVFVRGGTPSENLVLIDGIPIYQPFHILGFFSVFPEDLVSSVDFYAGGFGARYSGRTSSVMDVRIRDGDPNEHRVMGSVSPFLAEALVQGPWEGGGVRWLASVRRSLIEETSGTFLGTTQPQAFESQMFKVTSVSEGNTHCSALGLHTSDRGRLDPEEKQSRVEWGNLLGGLRCVTLRGSQLLDVNFSYSRSTSTAVSRGSSELSSSIWRMQHDVHSTRRLGSLPINSGYNTYLESMDYDLTELFGSQRSGEGIFGASAYVETDIALGSRIDLKPGLVLSVSPVLGLEPRLRAGWQPFGRPTEMLQGAVGLYRQNGIGASDTRDVSSVFTAWMSAPENEPLQALHTMLGWQQTVGDLRFSLEGYYKQMEEIPVPIWTGVAQFTTRLSRADGDTYGADTRIEFTRPSFYAFIGYGYSWTRYKASQAEFSTWFGEPVQHYSPPHDRRHQINALTSFELAGFRTSARWQFGTGLPFTRPMGFDDAFDFTKGLHDVHTTPGTPRLVLDKPYTGRLPMTHRLDVSIERSFDLAPGRLVAQAGVINAYDRRNMFYYDLYSGRRADQLPLAPYLSFALRTGDRGAALGAR